MEYNKIINQIKSGKTAVGLNIAINSPHMVEFFGSMGFDWVFIDCEHGSMTDSEAENMIRSADLYGIAPVVRVPANEPHLILKMLDAGAKGIVVPHIDNLGDAIKARDAAKYPPLGKRGSNYGTGRNNKYGSLIKKTEDYYKFANDNRILFALIESQEAVENIDEILSVDGIDATWLGPSDMALSMGLPDKKEIDKNLELVVRKTIDKGKISAATHSGPKLFEEYEHFHRLGSRVLSITAFSLLQESAIEWQSKIRKIK